MSEKIKSEREFTREDIVFEDMFLVDGNEPFVAYYLEVLPKWAKEIFQSLFESKIGPESIEYVDCSLLYNIKMGHIEDSMEILVGHVDLADEQSFEYDLSDAEKTLFEAKMREYVCKDKTLNDLCAEYHAQ